LIIINLYYPSPKDPPYPIEEVRKEKVLHPTEVDHHANGWIRYAPDLMIRPVARIVRELPPSLCDWWWWLVLNSNLPFNCCQHRVSNHGEELPQEVLSSENRIDTHWQANQPLLTPSSITQLHTLYAFLPRHHDWGACYRAEYG